MFDEVFASVPSYFPKPKQQDVLLCNKWNPCQDVLHGSKTYRSCTVEIWVSFFDTLTRLNHHVDEAFHGQAFCFSKVLRTLEALFLQLADDSKSPKIWLSRPVPTLNTCDTASWPL